MASSLFPNTQRAQGNSQNPTSPMPVLASPVQMLNSIKAMASGNPQAMFNQMLNSNPQFAKFVSDNKGLTPEQIAKNYGVDLSQFKNLFH